MTEKPTTPTDNARGNAVLPPGMRDESLRKIYNPIQKNWAAVAKYGLETNGAYSLGTGSLEPGGANGAHWHGSYSETFTATKGAVGVYSKSTGKKTLQPGESVTVPPREPHYFFNESAEEVEFETKIVPAHEGFEKALYVMYGLARDGKGGNAGVAKSLLDTAVICSVGDMWPAGKVGTVLIPVLKGLRVVAKVTGREEKLIKKYWG